MTHLQEQLDQHYARRLELDRELRSLAVAWRNFERAHPNLHVARAANQLSAGTREQQHLRGTSGGMAWGRPGLIGTGLMRETGFRDPQQRQQQQLQQQREEDGDLSRLDKQLEMATRVRHALDKLEAHVKDILRHTDAQPTSAVSRGPATRKSPPYECPILFYP